MKFHKIIINLDLSQKNIMNCTLYYSNFDKNIVNWVKKNIKKKSFIKKKIEKV